MFNVENIKIGKKMDDKSFINLIQKALKIDDEIIDKISVVVSIENLNEWAKGENLPVIETREHIIFKITGVMLQYLQDLLDKTK